MAQLQASRFTCCRPYYWFFGLTGVMGFITSVSNLQYCHVADWLAGWLLSGCRGSLMSSIKALTDKLRWHLNLRLVKTAIWLLTLSGWYKGYWDHWRYIFEYVERKDLHILPVHYYSPIPDTRELPEELWLRDRLPIGFNLRIDPALVWLDQLRKFSSEYDQFPEKPCVDPHKYHLDQPAYRSGDAEILYAIIRDIKPRQIIEIGSGYSTLLISQAILCEFEKRGRTINASLSL